MFMLCSSFASLAYTNPSNGQHKPRRKSIAIFLFSIATRFKNEEGSFYLFFFHKPSVYKSFKLKHKRGRRFIEIFLFSIASLFKKEEGSCYLLSSTFSGTNPSD